MTDTPPPSTDPDDDDLLASLYLDGVANPEERARVEADPELMAKVDQLAAISGQIADLTPPAGLRGQHIDRALDEFDRQRFGQQVAASGLAPVTSLGSKRTDRRRSPGLPSWLGAAAATAVILGGLGFAATQLQGDDDDEAASTDLANEEVSASSGNRQLATTPPAMAGAEESSADMEDAANDGEALEADEAEIVGNDDDLGPDAVGDDAMDDAITEDALADTGPAPPATEPAPIQLDDLDGTTAAEFYELLIDQPLLPLTDSPCADSPLVQALIDVDGYLPVVFDGQLASLLVQGGVADSAVIVGPTCQVELE